MKRSIVVLALIACAAAGFALELSAGAGLAFGSFRERDYFETDANNSLEDIYSATPFGLGIYLDATYALLSLGLRGHGSMHRENTLVIAGFTIESPPEDIVEPQGFLSLALLGRYPFALGPVTLFPLAGIEYDLNLWWRDADDNDLKAGATAQEKADLNELWIRLGAGADIGLGKGFAIRAQATLAFKLLNEGERQDIQDAEDGGATAASITATTFDAGIFLQYRIAALGSAKR